MFSSDGRAGVLQASGHWFDSSNTYQRKAKREWICASQTSLAFYTHTGGVITSIKDELGILEHIRRGRPEARSE